MFSKPAMARSIPHSISSSRKAGLQRTGGRAKTTAAPNSIHSRGWAAGISNVKRRTGSASRRPFRTWPRWRREMRFERWFCSIPLRLRSRFRRDAVESELDEEMQFQIEQKIQQYIPAGLTAEDARHRALRAIDAL